MLVWVAWSGSLHGWLARIRLPKGEPWFQEKIEQLIENLIKELQSKLTKRTVESDYSTIDGTKLELREQGEDIVPHAMQ